MRQPSVRFPHVLDFHGTMGDQVAAQGKTTCILQLLIDLIVCHLSELRVRDASSIMKSANLAMSSSDVNRSCSRAGQSRSSVSSSGSTRKRESRFLCPFSAVARDFDELDKI